MVINRLKMALLTVALLLFFFFLTANRPVVGQESQGDDFQATVKQKLEQILSNQANILAQLDALKEETVKARIWNR